MIDYDEEIGLVVDEVTAMLIDRKGELSAPPPVLLDGDAVRLVLDEIDAQRAALGTSDADVEKDELDLVWQIVLLRVARLNTPVPYAIPPAEVL